jgi:hypothetical protein
LTARVRLPQQEVPTGEEIDIAARAPASNCAREHSKAKAALPSVQKARGRLPA